MSLTNKWFPNINIYLCHMCINSVGRLGIESVVRRIEKRTNVKKVILLPEWSSGGVTEALSKFLFPLRVSSSGSFLVSLSWLLSKFFRSFYLHCWNSPWRSFLAAEPIIMSKSKRRFRFCCFICGIVLRKCLSLLVWKRKVKGDVLFSVSCLSLSCACLYCPALTLCLLVVRICACLRYNRQLKNMLAQEVPKLLHMFIQFIFVLELRRCVGIRMCNSNTPMDTSLFLTASPRVMRVDEYIANYICTFALI